MKTVRELIAELSECDQDAFVFLEDRDYGYGPGAVAIPMKLKAHRHEQFGRKVADWHPADQDRPEPCEEPVNAVLIS